jgi:CBS domain-containing protein
MWRNDRERPDDPQTRENETERLSRDEYDRPRYGSPPPGNHARHEGTAPQQNQSYERAKWSYASQPAARFRGDPRGHWPHGTHGTHGTHDAQQPERAQDAGKAPQQRDFGGQPQRTLDQIRAHELMTRRVATVHPASSVERAARLMEECDCGALPIVGDNGVLVGMVTDRDIALRIVARGREVRNAIVADCMTEHVFACYANESIAECMRQMARHRVRRMPIVDERGRLVGILAQGDLARHAGRHPVTEERRTLAQVIGELSEPAHTSRR